MHKLRMLAVLTAMILLSGCVNDYIRDRGNDYRSAELYPVTQLPEGYDDSRFDTLMLIPEQGDGPKGEEFVVPRPNAIVLAGDTDLYRIEQDGNARWILSQKKPGQVWPALISFWESSGINLEVNDPANGEMETSWVVINETEQKDQVRRIIGNLLGSDISDDMQDKFRINMQQGVQEGTTEVHLLHARAPADEENPAVNWGTDDTSDLVQSAMLNEMLVFALSLSDEPESVSLVAQDLSIGTRTSLVEDGNGNPTLRLDLAYDRSWAAIGRALQATTIKVVDRDRGQGLYYLEINHGEELTVATEEEEEGGLFDWFSDDDATDNKPGVDSYQLRLTRVGSQVKVTLERSVTELAPREISLDLLTLLKDNLS
ncbi:outer membrane protein assembly factor BamC [Aestuariirhabdus sp. Z084]|uniref:outer membrane protein assembly factor BamC n=1 Tax=Aestuariirhabdus haliotis TaxID=2918751 RepID=UPI00201B3E26|nr:outer membrane protein assembly factor BamC [Aestuariirhabdus haliotis]MCL6416335.1 outer membrane protein assembly factor BamC [Aestuariirhabdus haliotis]MCL6420208.1 outer membrane protein assembly factor BamC [Aestuariirhabdus haliotis]